jgi:hypothetical protein
VTGRRDRYDWLRRCLYFAVRQEQRGTDGLDARFVIDFSAQGGAEAMRLDGWSYQEPHGVWAVNDISAVSWPGAGIEPGATLDFDIEPCLIAPYRSVQRLWVRLEGAVESARLEIGHTGIFRLRLPQAGPAQACRKLVFYHPDGIVPSESGGLVDGRKLSLFFRSISLVGPEPAPANEADLVARFESLGGTAQGCEFGLLQREAGVEPLGLLRWATMTASSLADALESGFEGVGTPGQTILDKFTWPDGRQEYSTEDRRFLMRMHTWIDVASSPPDEVLAMMCRRLTFLTRKLFETFAQARKIFVFKTGDRICAPDEIRRIHQAMRRYGPVTLLYVQQADQDHPPGSVDRLKEGLLVGYIDRFNQAPDGTVLPLSRDIWLQICRRAAAPV